MIRETGPIPTSIVDTWKRPHLMVRLEESSVFGGEVTTPSAPNRWRRPAAKQPASNTFTVDSTAPSALAGIGRGRPSVVE